MLLSCHHPSSIKWAWPVSMLFSCGCFPVFPCGDASGTNTCSPRDSTMPILTAATPRMPEKNAAQFPPKWILFGGRSCMKLLNWITQACTAVKQFFASTSNLTIMRLDNTSSRNCLTLAKTHPNMSTPSKLRSTRRSSAASFFNALPRSGLGSHFWSPFTGKQQKTKPQKAAIPFTHFQMVNSCTCP